MTPKERVRTALAHEQPDRVPLEMSFTPAFAQRLRERLFGESGERHNPHGGGNDYALEIQLGLDVLLTSVGWANSYYAGETYNPGADHYTDEWGVGWKNVRYETRFGSGFYTEFGNPPLADDDAIDSYRPPDPKRPELYTAVERTVRDYGAAYWITGSCQTTIWETAVALRGFETLLMDVIEDPELCGRILDIPQRYHTAVCRRLVELGVDMVWLGDDIGAQNSMIMSPAPTHHVQLDTPLENLLALVETAKNPRHGS